MGAAKCRWCQANLAPKTAFMLVSNNKKAFFCNEEHCDKYIEKSEQIKKDEEQTKKNEKQTKAEKVITAEEQERKAKRKADKDKVYWLICDIIDRKEIVNPVLYKEWKAWNKVATDEYIGKYLEQNKTYLMNTMSKLEDIEMCRIKYLSVVIRSHIGDYSRQKITTEERPVVKVDESFYGPAETNHRKKRRSLEDLEDEF